MSSWGCWAAPRFQDSGPCNVRGRRACLDYDCRLSVWVIAPRSWCLRSIFWEEAGECLCPANPGSTTSNADEQLWIRYVAFLSVPYCSENRRRWPVVRPNKLPGDCGRPVSAQKRPLRWWFIFRFIVVTLQLVIHSERASCFLYWFSPAPPPQVLYQVCLPYWTVTPKRSGLIFCFSTTVLLTVQGRWQDSVHLVTSGQAEYLS